MDFGEKQFIKEVLKLALWLGLLTFSCKFTKGGTCVLIVLYGIWAAFQNKLGSALVCYLLLPFLMIANPNIVPKGGIASMALRLGGAAVTAALILAGSKRPGRHVLPLSGMFAYLVCAMVSSVGGYAPMISFLKVINFSILMFGLWLGMKNIDRRPEEIYRARKAMLALAVVIIGGSFLLLFYPAYGYVNTVNQLLHDHPDLTREEVEVLLVQYSSVKLFAGMTNQSQCLAIVLPVTMAWVCCDMLFVQKKLSKLHLLLLILGMPMIYLTRSRSALLTAGVGGVMIYFFAINKVQISQRIKRTLRAGMTGLVFLAAVGAVYLEVKDHSFSKWIRKTDDVEYDQRSFKEALTSSRLGLVNNNMRDFRRNPLLGSGFQVSEQMRGMSGFRLSATIEKGVLPTMVLGETGVVGFVAFLFFLAMFYGGCIHKKFVVTASLFTMMLAANMGEANFFSPGGPGGVLWTITVGGGFLIDTVVICERRRAMRPMRYMPW